MGIEKFKRKIDYDVLERIEEKLNTVVTKQALLEQKVDGINSSLFKNNGTTCMETRLKNAEDKLVGFNTTKQSIIFLGVVFMSILTVVVTGMQIYSFIVRIIQG